jgi:hypothetical protein
MGWVCMTGDVCLTSAAVVINMALGKNTQLKVSA